MGVRFRQCAALAVMALLAGCASTPAPVIDTAAEIPVSQSPISTLHDDVLFEAFSHVGTPYRYGGSSPSTGFDCSGLIHYVYNKAAGVTLPRTTSGLYTLQSAHPKTPLQPGDLLLFATSGRKVDHAGIYVGDGRFLHAPSSGGKVRVDSLHAGYWQRSYLGSRRVLD
ncbi:C40 family peptidase [Halopseudomonas nanhaiensis]|uniref:C40 family peptidase n=1 Tax=Halopseudomonas nanhaiensis TaxID=2830842 RepID=UPI001CBF13B0|nr:C40 family peptidase [Halopseudomonas nanhaiensis]UAW97144.1 C40 family peptidase [Halopseudomonas nanhaiensis]